MHKTNFISYSLFFLYRQCGSMENNTVPIVSSLVLVERYICIPLYIFMTIFYIFFLIMMLHNSKKLSNSYYTILKGLAIADIGQMIIIVYNNFCSNLNLKFYLDCVSCQWLDFFLVTMQNILQYASYAIHLNILLNRLVAIFMFSKYKQLFTIRRANYLNMICFLFGFFAFSPTLILKLYHFQPYIKFWTFDDFYPYIAVDKVLGSITITTLTISSVFAGVYSWMKLKKTIVNRSSYKMEIKMLIQTIFMTSILIVGSIIVYTDLQGIPPLAGKFVFFMFNGMNPFIYLAMDKTIRKLCRNQLAMCFFCCRSNIVVPVSQISMPRT